MLLHMLISRGEYGWGLKPATYHGVIVFFWKKQLTMLKEARRKTRMSVKTGMHFDVTGRRMERVFHLPIFWLIV